MQGLKQGDGLAPTLFNLALEKVIRGTSVDVNTTIFQKAQQITGYADDLNILGRSISVVKEAFGNLEDAAKEVCLKVNEDKTKFLLQTRKQKTGLGQNIAFDRYNFEVVKEFTYLGSEVNMSNDESSKVTKRISAANRTFFSILPIMKSRNVHRESKL